MYKERSGDVRDIGAADVFALAEGVEESASIAKAAIDEVLCICAQAEGCE